MILRNLNVNVNNNKTSTSPSIVLYKNDKGVLLNINLQNFKFNISEIGKIDISVTNIDTNNKFILKSVTFKDNNILLPISHGSSEWRYLEIGTYKAHIHIYDSNMNRISAPSFDIVCKDTIY